MEKSGTIARNEISPYIISAAIHILALLLIFSISYRNYYYFKKKSLIEAAHDIQIDSIAISRDSADVRTEPDQEYRRTESRRGTGPYGLNDEAGRELWECARSGISVTPDNFLEYAKIRELRKGLNLKQKNDIFQKYPFLTGSSQFQSGVGKKLKTDYQECHEHVCRIINFHEKDYTSSEDTSDEFTAAALDYLNGNKAVRTWRTLWMVPAPATRQDKIELVRLLRRLHNYHIDGENAGYEHMRGSLKSIIDLIPDELKFTTIRNN